MGDGGWGGQSVRGSGSGDGSGSGSAGGLARPARPTDAGMRQHEAWSYPVIAQVTAIAAPGTVHDHPARVVVAVSQRGESRALVVPVVARIRVTRHSTSCRLHLRRACFRLGNTHSIVQALNIVVLPVKQRRPDANQAQKHHEAHEAYHNRHFSMTSHFISFPAGNCVYLSKSRKLGDLCRK